MGTMLNNRFDYKFYTINVGGQAQGKGAGTQKTQQSEKSSKTYSKPTESGPNVAMANQINVTVTVGDKDKQKQAATEGGSTSTSLNGTSTGKGLDRQADETTQAQICMKFTGLLIMMIVSYYYILVIVVCFNTGIQTKVKTEIKQEPQVQQMSTPPVQIPPVQVQAVQVPPVPVTSPVLPAVRQPVMIQQVPYLI